jgi:hypothetical protein
MTTPLCRLMLLVGMVAGLQYALRAENEDIPWDKLRERASSYLEACSTPKEVAGMERKLHSRVQQRMQDNETLGEDSIMRCLMIDWAAGNVGKIKRKDRETITQACFYFVTFIDRGFLVPQLIRSQLTPSALKDIFDHLDGEIAKSNEKKKGA